MKRLAATLSAIVMLCNGMAASAEIPIQGKLLYHSYSSYAAMDSTLYLHDFRTGETRSIESDAYIHAMNADFGSHCADITFMAIDPIADEWDVFRYNAISGESKNLTENSGFRNEDPKFSPDGKRIVFKRGRWDAQTDGFVYDLAELELQTGSITMLTDSIAEESMPYYTPDGKSICYSEIAGGETAICSLDIASRKKSVIYAEQGAHAYYPVCSQAGLYFTKWHSAQVQSDCIVKFDEVPVPLPMNSENCNTSDPFALDNGNLFFSSTRAGSYDLYFYDGQTAHALTALSTQKEELGSAYFGIEDARRIISETTDFLLQRSNPDLNMDADANGTVNAFDLAMLKKMAQ